MARQKQSAGGKPARQRKTRKGKEETAKATPTLFQFKITLVDSSPPIWRRIQVEDCTLDKLHEHIQTAMDWTNSHLHQFEMGGERYGDPELLDDFDCIDSTGILISETIPETSKRFRFSYEYDFGDGWEHEILFEGRPQPEPGRRYPICLAGERARPPEDIGGIFGYADFLEALQNKSHDRHEETLEWAGGWFDPEAFDPAAATKNMREGPPHWRD
jgi:hypothetical protein